MGIRAGKQRLDDAVTLMNNAVGKNTTTAFIGNMR